MDKQGSQEKNNKNTFFSEWLEKLQQESWQLELLISGLALYGVFESRSLLIDFQSYINLYTEDTFHDVLIMFYRVLWVGWRIFLINLLIHIVLRGLWIGAIGLRYVSGDIDFEKLNYSNLFTTYLKKRIGSYDSFIEKLEKICSILFAYTFLLFLLFFSFILYFSFIGLFQTLLESFFPDFQYQAFFGLFVIVYLLLGLIVFIDLISLGGFKRIKEKSVSKAYFVIYRVVSILTLSFLYRPILYNFLDQKYTKRLFFFSIPYILIIAFGSVLFDNNIYTYVESKENLQKSGLMINNRFYQDLRDKSLKYNDKTDQKKINYDMPYILLDKYYMDNIYPSLFFKMTKNDKRLLKNNKSIAPIFKEGVNFTLFNNGNPIRISDLTESVLQVTIDSLHSERRTLKKTSRKAKRTKNIVEVDLLQIKIDSLDKVIDLLKEKRNQSKETKKKENYLGIINAFMDHIDVKIDEVNYKDKLDCKYYTHPSSGHKGFLCHFRSDSLSIGPHEISFERTYFENRKQKDSTFTYRTKLPFIKIK